jgi:hypothetical protein
LCSESILITSSYSEVVLAGYWEKMRSALLALLLVCTFGKDRLDCEKCIDGALNYSWCRDPVPGVLDSLMGNADGECHAFLDYGRCRTCHVQTKGECGSRMIATPSQELPQRPCHEAQSEGGAWEHAALPGLGAKNSGIVDLASGEPRPFVNATGNATGVIVSVISRFGSGTYDASAVATLADGSHVTIHLGGVYPRGGKRDFERRMLGVGSGSVRFPLGSRATFFAAGKRERLDNFRGLSGVGFAYTGQKGAFAAYASSRWLLLVVGTTGANDPAMLNWLRNVLGQAGARGVVVLAHRPLHRDDKVRDLLGNRSHVWIFGRRRGTAFFVDPTSVAHVRGIGPSGAPALLAEASCSSGIEHEDGRTYRILRHGAGLDTPVGYNGLLRLNVTGNMLAAEYRTIKLKSDWSRRRNLSAHEAAVDMGAYTATARELFTVNGRGEIARRLLCTTMRRCRIAPARVEAC